MPRTIFHADLDAFFASCEEREHPEYHGKPLVVGADPKGGAGRGVVSTANYAARKYGIHSAMPISRAYKLCPSAVFVRPDFHLYGRVSAAVMDILRSHADSFQQVSIDEAFLDVSSKISSNEDAIALATAMQHEIREQEKLSCSIGIAANKLVAKIASDYDKPAGLTFVEAGREKAFLAKLPVRKLIGVGPKTEIALKHHHIETIGQLARLPFDFLQEQFGKFGLYLRNAANGMDDDAVAESGEIKSISRHATFEQDTKDTALILDTLTAMAADAHRQLDTNGLACRTVGIRVRYENFDTHTREHTLALPTADLGIISSFQRALLTDFLADKRKIRLIGVRLSNLQPVPAAKQRLIREFAVA